MSTKSSRGALIYRVGKSKAPSPCQQQLLLSVLLTLTVPEAVKCCLNMLGSLNMLQAACVSLEQYVYSDLQSILKLDFVYYRGVQEIFAYSGDSPLQTYFVSLSFHFLMITCNTWFVILNFFLFLVFLTSYLTFAQCEVRKMLPVFVPGTFNFSYTYCAFTLDTEI